MIDSSKNWKQFLVVAQMHTQSMHYMHIYTQAQGVKAEVVTSEDWGYENGTSATGKHIYIHTVCTNMY